MDLHFALFYESGWTARLKCPRSKWVHCHALHALKLSDYIYIDKSGYIKVDLKVSRQIEKWVHEKVSTWKKWLHEKVSTWQKWVHDKSEYICRCMHFFIHMKINILFVISPFYVSEAASVPATCRWLVVEVMSTCHQNTQKKHNFKRESVCQVPLQSANDSTEICCSSLGLVHQYCLAHKQHTCDSMLNTSWLPTQ
jgi:hypothetical protein